RSRGRCRLPAGARARAQGCTRPRADGLPRARLGDERILRPAIRCAAVDLDRGIWPRHPDRQHADRAPLRHVRARSALSAARPRRFARRAGGAARGRVAPIPFPPTPADVRLTPAAEKRLKVLQSLDTLGAGFMLASHDLDIRGAGNLLGEEQSGHIREVGFELYQSMLEEAVMALKGGEGAGVEDPWRPALN